MTGDMSTQSGAQGTLMEEAALRALWECADLQDARLHYGVQDDFGKCHLVCNIYCDSCTGINEKACDYSKETTLMNINQLINHARDSDEVLDQIIKTSEMEVQHIL